MLRAISTDFNRTFRAPDLTPRLALINSQVGVDFSSRDYLSSNAHLPRRSLELSPTLTSHFRYSVMGCCDAVD
jgi:hypothetical protein